MLSKGKQSKKSGEFGIFDSKMQYFSFKDRSIFCWNLRLKGNCFLSLEYGRKQWGPFGDYVLSPQPFKSLSIVGE